MEDGVSNMNYTEQKSNSIMLFVMEELWQDVNVDRFYFEKTQSVVASGCNWNKVELNGKRKIRRGSEKGVNHGG